MSGALAETLRRLGPDSGDGHDYRHRQHAESNHDRQQHREGSHSYHARQRVPLDSSAIPIMPRRPDNRDFPHTPDHDRHGGRSPSYDRSRTRSPPGPAGDRRRDERGRYYNHDSRFPGRRDRNDRDDGRYFGRVARSRSPSLSGPPPLEPQARAAFFRQRKLKRQALEFSIWDILYSASSDSSSSLTASDSEALSTTSSSSARDKKRKKRSKRRCDQDEKEKKKKKKRRGEKEETGGKRRDKKKGDRKKEKRKKRKHEDERMDVRKASKDNEEHSGQKSEKTEREGDSNHAVASQRQPSPTVGHSKASSNPPSSPEIGPQPQPLNTESKFSDRDYGGALLAGEGSAIAMYVQSGKRIPRRGEIGLTSDQIQAYEDVGYVMSGSRHRRMNAVRIRKENQIISAEEKRALLLLNEQERVKKEARIVSEFKESLERRIKRANQKKEEEEKERSSRVDDEEEEGVKQAGKGSRAG